MGYIGKSPEQGRYGKLDQISSGFNGSTATFNLTVGSEAVYPVNPQALIISLNGVIQQPGTDFTVSSATITFTTNPASGVGFFGVILGDALDIGTPSDGSVTVAKMAANSVDSAQYVDGSIDRVHLVADIIDGTKIADDVINSEHYAAASIDNEHLATGIDAIKLADGSVTNAELQYINTLTENVQTRMSANATAIAAKAAVGSGTPSTQTLPDTADTGTSTEAARLDHIHTMPAGGSNSFTNDVTVTSGNLVMATAGKGIDFSAASGSASGSASALLDDYEEGSWTPVFRSYSTDSATQNIQNGRYTKIGNIVFFMCAVSTSSISGLTASDDAQIFGLPFTTASTSGFEANAFTGNGYGFNLPNYPNTVSGNIPTNHTRIALMLWEANAGTSGMRIDEWSSNGNIRMSGYYTV